MLFSVYCKLIVDNGATLRAVGTPVDSIRFDVLPPNTTWHGIRFLSASDSSRLEYCLLTHGKAIGLGEDVRGGAIYCYYSNPTICHSTITGNMAYENNYWGTGFGGGIYCDGSSPNLRHNIINGNSAGYFEVGYGGGICCINNSNPSILSNTICGNMAGNQGEEFTA